MTFFSADPLVSWELTSSSFSAVHGEEYESEPLTLPDAPGQHDHTSKLAARHKGMTPGAQHARQVCPLVSPQSCSPRYRRAKMSLSTLPELLRNYSEKVKTDLNFHQGEDAQVMYEEIM